MCAAVGVSVGAAVAVLNGLGVFSRSDIAEVGASVIRVVVNRPGVVTSPFDICVKFCETIVVSGVTDVCPPLRVGSKRSA
ncbi:MAG: hypothetical protein OHK0046_47210 [Anaerolineae bacterium]